MYNAIEAAEEASCWSLQTWDLVSAKPLDMKFDLSTWHCHPWAIFVLDPHDITGIGTIYLTIFAIYYKILISGHCDLGKGAENQNGNLRWHLP